MNALPKQPESVPEWKEEISRRLAAHKNRKGSAVAVSEAEANESTHTANSRAAQLAARVAMRYAKAPTYSEMLAEEARAAVRAAEVAAHAALEAHAAAESVLAGIEAAANIEGGVWEPEFSHAEEISTGPVLVADPQPEPVLPHIEAVAEEWREVPTATVIEFSRELYAVRKMRPRLSEGPLAQHGHEEQMSIFDIAPSSISTEPEIIESVVSQVAEQQGPVWAGIELEAQPMVDSVATPTLENAKLTLPLAPLDARAMALVVDSALCFAITCLFGVISAAHVSHLPGMKQTELIAVLTFLVISMVYHSLFAVFTGATPGMRYAKISLCTFDEQEPTRRQLWIRIGTMILSTLPMGLGVLWSIFDEEHLTWHDRVSGTYLRSV